MNLREPTPRTPISVSTTPVPVETSPALTDTNPPPKKKKKTKKRKRQRGVTELIALKHGCDVVDTQICVKYGLFFNLFPDKKMWVK